MWSYLIMALALAAEPFDPEALPLETVVFVQQGGAACAGTFVDDQGTVATAYHCVTTGGRPKIVTRDGRTAIGKVSRVQASVDIALIRVPDFAGEPFAVTRDADLRLGEVARAVGHPYGARKPAGYVEGTLRWSVTEGVVSGVGPYALQVSAPVNRGSSGGPVFDEQGRLIGVVSRGYGGDGVAFATRAGAIDDLMEGGGRRFGAGGGTLAVEAFLGAWDAGAGTLSAGVRGEVAFRDRLIVGAAFALPLTARWDVTRFGNDVHWSQLEGRLGLRQRLFRGTWTTALEAYGGVAQVRTLSADPDTVYRSSADWAPMAGGSVGLLGVGVDLAAIFMPGEVALRLQVVFRWPGVFWMF